MALLVGALTRALSVLRSLSPDENLFRHFVCDSTVNRLLLDVTQPKEWHSRIISAHLSPLRILLSDQHATELDLCKGRR